MRPRIWLTLLVASGAVAALGGCERTFRDMYDQPRYKPLAASTLWADGRASRPPVEGTVARSAGAFAGTTSGRAGALPAAPAVPPLAAIRDELRPTDVTGARNTASAPPQPGAAAAASNAASAAATKSAGEATTTAATSPKVPGATGFTMPPITSELLARGRERFDIFCAPCHSIAGDGDGFVARRGFPHPPSYHLDRLRSASDAHLYAVISEGYGAMYPYARRLVPSDRMAVVAYIRALQLSQHAPLDAVPADVRARLEAQ